jgi:hypothetical protein
VDCSVCSPWIGFYALARLLASVLKQFEFREKQLCRHSNH